MIKTAVILAIVLTPSAPLAQESWSPTTTTGAPALTTASPVTIPTLSGPNSPANSKNFSLTRALIGAV